MSTRHTAGVTSPERAEQVLRALRAGGVREVVLAPGSRSAPLALALYAADVAGALRLHVRVDERTAGFLAVGLSIGSRQPVAVVTTSGTAVGNLLPAVMEAHHSGRRVVVLSADRPAALRGTGANQTTWQAGIFGRFAPCWDLAVAADPAEVTRAVAEALATAGPSQLNVQFDAPLVPAPGQPWWPDRPPSGPPDGAPMPGRAGEHPRVPHDEPHVRRDKGVHDAGEPQVLPRGPRTVVVAGDDSGSAARIFAETHGLPLLAEPTSGARAGRHAIRTYRLLLGAAAGLAPQIERVIVTGHPTLSRPVMALVSRTDLEVLAVRSPRTGVATDPGRCARVLPRLPTIAPAGPDATPSDRDRAWLQQWQTADRILAGRLDALVETLPQLHALQVAAEVGAALGPGQSLVVGSSNPVRDLDLMLAPYTPRQRRLVVGNRGLAGIDGTVSTALGVALGRPGMPRTLALVGDLTFLHDAGALWMGADEPRPELTVVVVNDDGGSIFALLEQGEPPYAAAFERVFATPHGADLAALCAASHTAYRLVGTRGELRAALADDTPRGLQVIEARVGRADRRATAAALAALATPGGSAGRA